MALTISSIAHGDPPSATGFDLPGSPRASVVPPFDFPAPAVAELAALF